MHTQYLPYHCVKINFMWTSPTFLLDKTLITNNYPWAQCQAYTGWACSTDSVYIYSDNPIMMSSVILLLGA